MKYSVIKIKANNEQEEMERYNTVEQAISEAESFLILQKSHLKPENYGELRVHVMKEDDAGFGSFYKTLR